MVAPFMQTYEVNEVYSQDVFFMIKRNTINQKTFRSYRL